MSVTGTLDLIGTIYLRVLGIETTTTAPFGKLPSDPQPTQHLLGIAVSTTSSCFTGFICLGLVGAVSTFSVLLGLSL